MRLFTYCIPVDDGAAPNPFHGVCTLAICKPKIRSVAQIDDWVVGLGSKNVAGIDYSGKVVYAMKVTDKMTLEEYDLHCKQQLPEKIPDIHHPEYTRRVGDCIYDFTKTGNNRLRPSVHNQYNIDTDLGGKNVLLSDHFYYFGEKAIPLDDSLRAIIHQGQGHKSNANQNYVQDFVLWIESVNHPMNTLLGQPQLILDFSNKKCLSSCAAIREEEGIKDVDCGVC